MAGAALALLLLGSQTASAKRVTVVPGDRPVALDVPAPWQVSEVARGIQARTAGDAVYLRFESCRPARFRTLPGEHDACFNGQGVRVIGTGTAKRIEFPTCPRKFTEYPATYEGKPTVLRSISVVPEADGERLLPVIDWASPEGDRIYDGDVQTIIDSLAGAHDGE